jgi:hypothetical protein
VKWYRNHPRIFAVRAAAALSSLLLVIAVAAPAEATTRVVNTIPAWNGSAYVYPFGEPETATYGQVITARSDTHRFLKSFRFIVNLPPSVKFRGYVYEWDAQAQRATGVARWSGLTRHTSAETWQPVTVNTGRLRLIPGHKYVLFLSVTGIPQQPRTGIFAQPQEQNLYAGGAFVFFNNSDVSDWTTQPWDGGAGDFLGPGGDLAFRVVFSD